MEATQMNVRLDCAAKRAGDDGRDAGARLVATFYEGLGVSEPQRPAPDYAASRGELADEIIAERGLS